MFIKISVILFKIFRIFMVLYSKYPSRLILWFDQLCIILYKGKCHKNMSHQNINKPWSLVFVPEKVNSLSSTYLMSLIDGGWALPWVSQTSLTFLLQPESGEPFLTWQGNPRVLLQMLQCDFLLILAPEE